MHVSDFQLQLILLLVLAVSHMIIKNKYNNNIIKILARKPEIGQHLGRILSCGAR